MQVLQGRRNAVDFSGAIQNVSAYKQAILSMELKAKSDPSQQLKQNLMSHYTALKQHEIFLQRYESVITEPKEAQVINPVEFVPKKLNLQNPEALPNEQIINHHREFCNLGINESNVRAPAYIKKVLEAEFNATHPKMREQVSTQDIDDAKAKNDSLIALLKAILGESSNPYYNLQGQVVMFDRHDYVGILSEGQKVLLQMAAALHAQNIQLNQALLFMDEPENHLHPAALVEVISRLQAILTEGQIWIATHSVPLIAHLVHDDPSCLWYMHDGKVTHAGRKPELVLKGLLGEDEGQKLQLFTQLPMQLAANRFLAECLLAPTTVGEDAADPQTNQIKKIIYELRQAKNGKLRVLDYGAGQGRLLAALDSISVTPTVEWLDYFAFDAFKNDKERCLVQIEQVYNMESSSQRYCNDLTSLKENCNNGSFDLIVMCNVLHEIDTNKWITELGVESDLQYLLASNGYLLLVEDYQMPVGEKAHQHGFMLMNTAELNALFDIKESDKSESKYLPYDARPDGLQQGRIKAHLIHKDLLMRLSSPTRKDAVTQLKRNSAAQVKALRDKAADFRSGQLYALAAQLYTNASLWLEEQA